MPRLIDAEKMARPKLLRSNVPWVVGTEKVVCVLVGPQGGRRNDVGATISRQIEETQDSVISFGPTPKMFVIMYTVNGSTRVSYSSLHTVILTRSDGREL